MDRPPKPLMTLAVVLVTCLPLTACIFATGKGDPVLGLGQTAATSSVILTLKVDKTLLIPGERLPVTAALSAAVPSLNGFRTLYASSDTKIATVDADGVVTAVNVGQVTISAVLGDKKGSITLRVVTSTAPDVVQVATIGLSPGSQTVERVGSQLLFTAVARDASNAAIPGIGFFWFSSDPNVATITPTGVLKIVGSGSTEVTAAAGDKKSPPVIIQVPGGSANVNVDFGAI